MVQSAEASEEELWESAVALGLEQMEALAVSAAAGELAPALLPALSDTLATVVHKPQDCGENITGVWACLADLLCSQDQRAAQVISHSQ